jgi:hypothetical protein
MTQAVVTSLSLRKPGFEPKSVHIGFVVEKVALGQVFLRILRFSPVIPPWLTKLLYHPGIYNPPPGVPSSHTVPPPPPHRRKHEQKL